MNMLIGVSDQGRIVPLMVFATSQDAREFLGNLGITETFPGIDVYDRCHGMALTEYLQNRVDQGDGQPDPVIDALFRDRYYEGHGASLANVQIQPISFGEPMLPAWDMP